MKKISFVSAIVLAAVSLAGIAPAQAEDQKTIAIIDSHFDSTLISGDVVEVCVVAKTLCDVVAQPITSKQFEDFNHGTIMADIVRQNNPTAKLILIRAANHTNNTVNGNGFNAALDWIILNKDVYGIDNVSFSYNVGNGTSCRPSTPGANIQLAHNDIVADIQKLKSAGIVIYAASGNYASGNRVDYPACIEDVVAVGSTQWRGSQPRSDIILGGHAYVSNTLKSDRVGQPNQNRFWISRNAKNEYKNSYTTSVTTAIVAATN
jgi:hypothetical protein